MKTYIICYYALKFGSVAQCTYYNNSITYFFNVSYHSTALILLVELEL